MPVGIPIIEPEKMATEEAPSSLGISSGKAPMKAIDELVNSIDSLTLQNESMTNSLDDTVRDLLPSCNTSAKGGMNIIAAGEVIGRIFESAKKNASISQEKAVHSGNSFSAASSTLVDDEPSTINSEISGIVNEIISNAVAQAFSKNLLDAGNALAQSSLSFLDDSTLTEGVLSIESQSLGQPKEQPISEAQIDLKEEDEQEYRILPIETQLPVQQDEVEENNVEAEVDLEGEDEQVYRILPIESQLPVQQVEVEETTFEPEVDLEGEEEQEYRILPIETQLPVQQVEFEETTFEPEVDLEGEEEQEYRILPIETQLPVQQDEVEETTFEPEVDLEGEEEQEYRILPIETQLPVQQDEVEETNVEAEVDLEGEEEQEYRILPIETQLPVQQVEVEENNVEAEVDLEGEDEQAYRILPIESQLPVQQDEVEENNFEAEVDLEGEEEQEYRILPIETQLPVQQDEVEENNVEAEVDLEGEEEQEYRILPITTQLPLQQDEVVEAASTIEEQVDRISPIEMQFPDAADSVMELSELKEREDIAERPTEWEEQVYHTLPTNPALPVLIESADEPLQAEVAEMEDIAQSPVEWEEQVHHTLSTNAPLPIVTESVEEPLQAEIEIFEDIVAAAVDSEVEEEQVPNENQPPSENVFVSGSSDIKEMNAEDLNIQETTEEISKESNAEPSIVSKEQSILDSTMDADEAISDMSTKAEVYSSTNSSMMPNDSESFVDSRSQSEDLGDSNLNQNSTREDLKLEEMLDEPPRKISEIIQMFEGSQKTLAAVSSSPGSQSKAKVNEYDLELPVVQETLTSAANPELSWGDKIADDIYKQVERSITKSRGYASSGGILNNMDEINISEPAPAITPQRMPRKSFDFRTSLDNIRRRFKKGEPKKEKQCSIM